MAAKKQAPAKKAKKARVPGVIPVQAKLQAEARDKGTTLGAIAQERAAKVKAPKKKAAAKKKPVARTPDEYRANIKELYEATKADIAASDAARQAAWLDEKAAELRAQEEDEGPIGEVAEGVERVRARRRAEKDAVKAGEIRTMSDEYASDAADVSTAYPQGAPSAPMSPHDSIAKAGYLKERIRALTGGGVRPSDYKDDEPTTDADGNPLLPKARRDLIARYQSELDAIPPLSDEALEVQDRIGRDAQQRRRDQALQDVKGRGRRVVKRRGKNVPPNQRTPLAPGQVPVTTPVTLADSRDRFMYFGYDYEIPKFQATPSADVPVWTMFGPSGDPNKPVGTFPGVQRNKFQTVSVAREEEILKHRIDVVGRDASIAERLARLPEMLKNQGDQREVIVDPTTGKRRRVGSHIMGLMRDIVSSEQFAGQSSGGNQGRNIQDQAVEALSFYKNLIARGGFEDTLKQASIRRQANTETSEALGGLPVGFNADPRSPEVQALTGVGRGAIPKRRGRMRASEIAAARDESSRRFDALTRDANNRTTSQGLTDFSEKLLNEEIPKMPTKYDPLVSGVRVAGGLRVEDLHEKEYADRVTRAAAAPRNRARSLRFVGPSPVLPVDAPDVALATAVPGDAVTDSLTERLNKILLRMGPDIERQRTVMRNYIDWANVGEGRTAGGGSKGSRGMFLPKSKDGKTAREPVRGTLIETPEGSTETPANPKLGDLEPTAKAKVAEVDASDRGVAHIARGYAALRKAVGIPKPGGTRGIGQDALLYSQTVAHYDRTIPELMGLELHGETADAGIADMSGTPEAGEIPIRNPESRRELSHWFGGMAHGPGGTNRPLTQNEYDDLPTGAPRDVTRTERVSADMEPIPMPHPFPVPGFDRVPASAYTDRVREAQALRGIMSLFGAVNPRPTVQTTTQVPTSDIKSTIDPETRTFPVTTRKMDSPVESKIPPHLGGQFSGQ